MCVCLHDILKKQNCLQTNKKIKIINADPLIIAITHENLLLCILIIFLEHDNKLTCKQAGIVRKFVN